MKKINLPDGMQDLDKTDLEAVVKVLESHFLTTGPMVQKFEQKIKEVTGAQFAIACSSGTSALYLACKAVGICEGDWVIVPSITFLATANAVRYCEGNVIFCDESVLSVIG